MEPLEIKGQITHIGEIEIFASGFSKRKFAVKELLPEDKYPQEFGIEFVKDKTAILDRYEVGDVVTVNANLRGSEYNGRHYVNLQAWKIAKDGQEPRDTRQNGAPPPKNELAAMSDALDEDDDIPF